MGNNPGKQRDNFENDGYKSSPRSSSAKLMDDDDQIQGFRTPRAPREAKRSSSLSRDKKNNVGKPDFYYNDTPEKKRSKNRKGRFFCGTRDSMIDE